jgi:predicted small secreted protein
MWNRLAAIVALAIAVTATGCNTIEGAGKDIKATGGAIEKAAGKAKTY